MEWTDLGTEMPEWIKDVQWNDWMSVIRVQTVHSLLMDIKMSFLFRGNRKKYERHKVKTFLNQLLI